MASQGKVDFVFLASNNHAPGCGKAPAIRNEEGGRYYYGYFENSFGEQWVFVFDGETRAGWLRGGDTSWDTEYPVVNGSVEGLMLDEPERQWLAACWKSAAKRSGSR